DVNVLCRPDHLLLDVEPEAREKLYQHLDHYIIADDVTLEDVTAATATIAIEGPKSDQVLSAMQAPGPEAPYASEEGGNRLVARMSFTGSLGFFIFAPVEATADLIAR